jgi:hypothetical protein
MPSLFASANPSPPAKFGNSLLPYFFHNYTQVTSPRITLLRIITLS